MTKTSWAGWLLAGGLLLLFINISQANFGFAPTWSSEGLGYNSVVLAEWVFSIWSIINAVRVFAKKKKLEKLDDKPDEPA